MRLHPNLYEGHNFNNLEEGGLTFTGGHLCIPLSKENGCADVINLDIEWDKKAGSWTISSPDFISTHEMQKFLDLLWDKIPEAFSDEEEILIKDLWPWLLGADKERQPKLFNTSGGGLWLTSNERYVAIEIGKGGKATGEIRSFKPHELVYLYESNK